MGNQNTSSVALEKTLEKYNHYKSEVQEAHQGVLELVEMEELEATVRSFHSFQQEIEDTAVRIQERLHIAIGQAGGTSGAQHLELDSADSVSQAGRSFSGFTDSLDGRTAVAIRPGSTGTAAPHHKGNIQQGHHRA